MIIPEFSLKIRRHRREILTGITCFVLGMVYMFFDSKDYYRKKLLSNRDFYWKVITNYQNSTTTSQSMVNNCYDAFYTIAKCDTKGGCNLIETAVKLRILNREREQLKEKYNALDNEIQSLMLRSKSE